MRLIDADGLQELFNVTSSALLSNPELTKDVEHMVRAFLMVSEMISDAPTIDAEPVVRCKDCIFYLQSNEECDLVKTRLRFYEKDKRWTEDCFCSWGERKEDGTK